MSQSRLDDLYDRLSSRKLWLCLLSIAFAGWNYAEGRMTAVEFQQFVTASVITFSVAEGAADAVAAYRPKPASGDAQTVNVGTEALPAVQPLTSAPAAATKRVRPSRAKKPKVPPAEPERVRVVPAGKG